MRVYADNQGALLGMRSDSERQRFGEPSGASATLDFDETTNASVLANLNTNWQAHTLVGGQLLKNGVAQAVQADGSAKQDQDFLATAIAKLKNGTITAAQQRRVLLYILRKLGQVVD